MCLQTPTHSETEAEREQKEEGERQSKRGPWELGPRASCSPSLPRRVKQRTSLVWEWDLVRRKSTQWHFPLCHIYRLIHMAKEQSANQPLSQNEERDNNQLCPGGKYLFLELYVINLHVKDPAWFFVYVKLSYRQINLRFFHINLHKLRLHCKTFNSQSNSRRLGRLTVNISWVRNAECVIKTNRDSLNGTNPMATIQTFQASICIERNTTRVVYSHFCNNSDPRCP